MFFYGYLLATRPFTLLVNRITFNATLWPPILAFMRQHADPGWGAGDRGLHLRGWCVLLQHGRSLRAISPGVQETIGWWWRLLASLCAGLERPHASSGVQEGFAPASLCRGRAMGMAGSATDRLPLLPLPDMLIADQVSF